LKRFDLEKVFFPMILCREDCIFNNQSSQSTLSIFASIFEEKKQKTWTRIWSDEPDFFIIYSNQIFFSIFYRFDANKSTKGASKLRRDLINAEIANLRDLLPLPQSTRQRLSQLQLMALVCVYVRKANYFQQGKKLKVFKFLLEFCSILHWNYFYFHLFQTNYK
jgi:hypothetical protein